MRLKNKKGSVAVYAILSLTILISFLFSLYVVVTSRHKNQLKASQDIKREIKDDTKSNEIEVVENPVKIDLHYNEAYKKHVDYVIDNNSDRYVYIKEENKIYKFTPTSQYYRIENI